MTRLEAALADYLSLRRSLGHKLDDAGRQLSRFVTYLDFTGAETITMPVVLEFVLDPDLDPASTIPARRLTAVRGFARYLAGQDQSSVIPPPGWSPPAPGTGSRTSSPTPTSQPSSRRPARRSRRHSGRKP